MTDRNPQHHQNGLLDHDTTQQLLAGYSSEELDQARAWLAANRFEDRIVLDGRDVTMNVVGVPSAVVDLLRAWFDHLAAGEVSR